MCAHQEGERKQAHTRPPCTEQEALQRWNELIGGQVATTAWPREPPQNEPSLRVERIQMMDFTSTHAQAKGVTSTASREEGHTVVIAARFPKASPPSTAEGVDKMYHKLAEICALATAQLAECAHWHRSNPTSNSAHAGSDWRVPTIESSMMRTAPLPPQARWQARQAGAPQEHCTWNLNHGEPSSWRRHIGDPKGSWADSPIDTTREATEELHSVAAQYATSCEAAQLCPAPCNGREASFDVTF
jgi:hypothetical protein